jgi:transcription initiation factor TFIIB
LFRRAVDAGLLVGQSIEAVTAACIHVTARENGVPYPLKQIADVSPVKTSAIRTAFSKLVREFSLKIIPPMPTAFIARFASAMGLSYKTRRLAFQLVDDLVEDEQHVGQSPTGVAAAALYGAAKASGESVTQERLAVVAFVSVVTLSRHWQVVKQYVDETEY